MANFFKQNGGFTLMELMTVIAMIMILSAITAANYRTAAARIALDNAAAEFAQDLRLAREMGLSLREDSGQQIYGYGVYVNNNNNGGGNKPAKEYKIYADQTTANYKYDAGVDAVIKTVNVGKENIEIKPCSFCKDEGCNSVETGARARCIDVFVNYVASQKFSLTYMASQGVANICKDISGINTCNYGGRYYGIRFDFASSRAPNITRMVVANNAGLVYVK